MAVKNNDKNGRISNIDIIAKFGSDVNAFTAYLDSHLIHVPAKVDKDGKVVKEAYDVRQALSFTAQFDDSIYLQALNYEYAKMGRLDNGSATDLVRDAMWHRLGYADAEYQAWAEAEAARISAVAKARGTGLGTAHAARMKEKDAKLEENASTIASLKAQIELLMAGKA